MSEWLSPRTGDPEITRRTLQAWFREKLPNARGDLVIANFDRPSSAGASGETYLVGVRWDDDAGPVVRDLVVRGAPSGEVTIYDSSIERQYRVLEALDRAAVPSPTPRWLELDSGVIGGPFLVMDRLPGIAPPDFPIYNEAGFLVEAEVPVRRRIWESAVDTLAAVHSVDAAPFAFLASSRHGDDPVSQALGYVTEALNWASEGSPPSGLSDVLEWAREHAPAAVLPGLTWGDARIGNMLFVDGRCTGVLDWEGAFFGGPLVDLAWWLLFDTLHGEDYNAPRLDGLGGRDETIARWERGTGMMAKDLEWYEILAGVRLGVARLRSINVRVKLRQAVPDEDDPRGVKRLVHRLEAMVAAAPL